MRTTKTVHVEEQKVVSITCDVCRQEYTDILDTQEFLTINCVGGYNSAIGDGVKYTCDICSKCVKRVLGEYLSTMTTY